MVVPTPAMVSLQVGFDLKENFDQKLPSVQSAAQADPVQEVTEGYNYEVTLMTSSWLLPTLPTSQVPEVTLAVRPEPVTTPRPTTPAALYGAPPASRRGRRGRRISQRRFSVQSTSEDKTHLNLLDISEKGSKGDE